MTKLIVGVITIVTAVSMAAAVPAMTGTGAKVQAAESSQPSKERDEAEQSSAPIVIPVDTIVRGNAGQEYDLRTMNVTDGEYKVHVESENQGSIHPDTDIVIRSGSDMVEVKDVEREAFHKEAADGTLKVENGKVTVYVRLGADKVFSGGMKVTLTNIPPIVPPTPPQPPQPPTPPTPPTPPVEPPQELPVTGPAEVAAIVAVTSVAAAAAHQAVSRRKLAREAARS